MTLLWIITGVVGTCVLLPLGFGFVIHAITKEGTGALK